jgi:hypothetical protein
MLGLYKTSGTSWHRSLPRPLELAVALSRGESGLTLAGGTHFFPSLMANTCLIVLYDKYSTFFAPAGLWKASKHLRPFTAIDGTHTMLQYRMMLLVACGIDENDHVVPLAWELVQS